MDIKKLVEDVTTGINYLGFDPKEFCVQMSKQHRTLQATFTTLCFAWLKACADMELKQRYDERNQYEIHKAAYLARLLPYFAYGENNPTIRTTSHRLSIEPYADYEPNQNVVDTGFDVFVDDHGLVTVEITGDGNVKVLVNNKDGDVIAEYIF